MGKRELTWDLDEFCTGDWGLGELAEDVRGTGIWEQTDLHQPSPVRQLVSLAL